MKRILASLLVLLALASAAGAVDYTIRNSGNQATTLQPTDSFQFQRNDTGKYFFINKSDLVSALGLAYTNISGLSTVAHTGAYSDLSGLPTLGTAAGKASSDNTKSSVASVSGATTSGHVCTFADTAGTVQDGGALVSSVAGRSGTVTLSTADVSGYVAPVNADWNAVSGLAQILNKPILAPVATSGAYGDLSGTPTIVSDLSQLGDVNLGALSDKDVLKYVTADGEWENGTIAWGEVTGKPSFAAVATSGAYGDLSGVPDLSAYVPTTRTVNGHALSGNISVTGSDVGLGSVENTALSTWPGTANVTTLGTVATGTWHATAIGDSYISSASTWNAKAASGANTDITSVLLNQTGLVIKGADSNALTIKDNETLTAGRTLNLKVNDGSRTVDLSGNLTVPSAATVSGTNTGDQTSVTGNAGTATALAANGPNCSAGSFPLGVDASGASESCTALPTTITGTANQITASASTGAITLSTPQDIATSSSPQFAGLNVGHATDTTITRVSAGVIAVEGTNVLLNGGALGTPSSGTATNLTGTAAGLTAGAATALAVNGSNCSAGSFPLGVDASGAAESCTTVSSVATVRYCWAGSDFNTTALTAATGVVDEYPIFPSTFTVTDVYAYVRTAPTGTLTIDINEGGTTIMASTKLTIDSGEFAGGSSGTPGTAATPAVVSDTSIAANAHITADIDSTTGGKGLVVCLIGHF